MIWKAKTPTSLNTYVDMLTPSTYKIEWEDFDSHSYRSISTGNLVRSRLSSKVFNN